MKNREALALLALTFIGGSGWAKGPAPACTVHGNWTFPRLANLPHGAEAALGFEMAELGGQWNPTDVIGPERPLSMPTARFITARQHNCTLEIDYEQGGIAHINTRARLRWTGTVWTLEERGGWRSVR